MRSQSDKGRSGRGRSGLLDRLAVRVDVVIRGGPPIAPVAIASGITAGGFPVAIAARSLPLAVATMAPLFFALPCLVFGLIRKLYCAANPYVTPRWLAAAWATFGGDTMTSVLGQIGSLYGQDEVLMRRDLVDAIALRRCELSRAMKVTRGVRLRDAMPQR